VSSFDLVQGAKRVTLPPGKYVISDPCYHVPDDQWDRVLDESDCFEDQCWASFITPSGTLGTVVAFSTAYGDGVYSYGSKDFGVDAGLIGIMPFEDVEFDPDSGHVFEFHTPFECFVEEGVIVFGHVEINTGEDPDDTYQEVDDEY
jgi:hypothetical protein